MHYPADSEQIKWVNSTFTPYDLCYDHWAWNGVQYSDGTIVPIADAGEEYTRPTDQTPEEQFNNFWQDKFTSNIKQTAYNEWLKNPQARFVDMNVNGYWELNGQCTCYQPNFLPPFIIFFFQLIGAIVEIDAQLWFNLPMTLIVWFWSLMDWLFDTVLIVSFFWFKPIAYIAIWAINIVQLPFNIIGWTNELMGGLVKAPVEAWMWLFGDGCFLMWGKNCWTDMPSAYRSELTNLDISIFSKPVVNGQSPLPDVPEFQNKSSLKGDWSRFTWDDIKASFAQIEYEAQLEKMVKNRIEKRNAKLLANQNAFDKTNLGMLMIQLGALVHELATPIAAIAF